MNQKTIVPEIFRPVARRVIPGILAMLCAGGLVTPVCPADTKTWTGNANSFWSEPGNWSPPGAPRIGAGRYTLTNGSTAPQQFFRLTK